MKIKIFTSLCFLFAIISAAHADNVVTGKGETGQLNAADYITNQGTWTMVHVAKGFTMNFEVENTSGASYNEWGSCILATGTDPIAASYTNGFQFYLNSIDNKNNGGLLLCKHDSKEYPFSEITYNESFSIQMDYDGSSLLTITVTYANGIPETIEKTAITLVDFSTLSYALPEGINITSLSITMHETESNDAGEYYYRIQNVRSGGYLCTDMYSSNYLSLKNTAQGNGTKNLWIVKQEDGSAFNTDELYSGDERTVSVQNLYNEHYVYIASKDTTKNLWENSTTSTDATNTDKRETSFQWTECFFQIKKNDDGSFVLKVNESKSNVWNNYASGGYLSTWSNENVYNSPDANSKFLFTKVYLSEYQINIIHSNYAETDYITIDGENYTASDVKQQIHSTNATLSEGDITTYPLPGFAGKVEINETQKTITVTYGIPTEFHYYIGNHRWKSYLSTATEYITTRSDGNINLKLSVTTPDEEATGQWVIYKKDGSLFNYLEIADGEEQTVAVRNVSNGKYIYITGKDDDTKAILSSKPCWFTIKKASNTNFFALKTETSQTNGWNYRDGYLSTWNHDKSYYYATGQGCWFFFEPIVCGTVRELNTESIKTWMKKITADATDDLFKAPSKTFVTKCLQEISAAINDGTERTDEQWLALYTATIKKLENDKDKDYYNLPQTGRYLIKNKGTGRYLTNYGELMNIVTPNYYSIWDLERTDEETLVTYTFLNEGTQYVMTPSVDATNGREDDGTAKKGYGYLTYTPEITRGYECKYDETNGLKTDNTYTEANTNKATLEFLPDGNGYARWHDVEDSYYACLMTSADKDWEINAGIKSPTTTKENYINNDNNQTVQSAICGGGTNELWEVIALNGYSEDIDNENPTADYTREDLIFYKTVRTDMEYYAGGPVTLDGVSTITVLQNIVDDINEKRNAIQEVTDPSDITYAATHAGYCSNILQAIHNLKSSNSEYYLSFSDNEIVYLENLDRPSEGARLTFNETPLKTNDGDLGRIWHTEDGLSDEDDRAMWELCAAEGEDTYYLLNKEKNLYITASADSTNDEKQAARITYSEVVPGIARLIYIKNDGTSGYFSITGTDAKNDPNGFGLVTYDVLELSGLWKIKCYNDLDVLGGASVTTGENEIFPNEKGEYNTINFSTFSYFMGTRLYPYGITQTNKNGESYTPYAKAYYASGKGINAEGNKLQVTLTEVPASDEGYTFLQRKEGFLIVGFNGTKLNNEDYPVLQMAATAIWPTEEGATVKFQSDMVTDGTTDGTPNLFRSTYNTPIKINNTTEQKKYFAVAHVTKGTPIGTYQGETVLATGLGFYNLKVGGKIGQNKAYIHSSQFSDYKFVGGKWENTKNSNGIKAKRGQSIEELDGVTCIQLVLQDTEGRETGIIDVDADGNTQYTPYIYDLSGRRVERPSKGIYIVNGEKKLFK